MKKKPVKNYQLPDALKEIQGFAPSGGGSSGGGSSDCNCSSSGGIYCSCASSSQVQVNCSCGLSNSNSTQTCASIYTTSVNGGPCTSYTTSYA